MKNKKPNQPTEFVRKTNEEILEAMKHAMRNSGGDPEITEILLKLMTFTPEEDAPKKAFTEIMVRNYSKYHSMKFGV